MGRFLIAWPLLFHEQGQMPMRRAAPKASRGKSVPWSVAVEDRRAGRGKTFQNSRDGPGFGCEIDRQSLARTMPPTFMANSSRRPQIGPAFWLSRGAGTGDSALNANIEAIRFAFVENETTV